MEDPESAIIFCNTREQTKRLAATLKEKGYSADWLNADLAQSDREKVMAATRKGELRFLVATDVAARGIDISHLTHVINYDLPESPEVYVHRTGRTGRAGRTGIALSMIAPGDVGNLYMLRLTYKIRPIEKQLPSEQEQWTRAETDVVKSLADLFTSRHPEPNDLSLARRLLTHDQAETIIAGLLRDHLGARPDLPEEAAGARRAWRPRPVSSDEASEPASTASEPPARRTRRRHRPASSETDDASQVGKVYVNVGRSDGARPTDILDLLQARAGLNPDQTEYVQVRPRHTFIGLRRQLIPKVVDALNGATIAGKEAVAEESRSRD
jgi:ATP-dependent RNA helicase DeaD